MKTATSDYLYFKKYICFYPNKSVTKRTFGDFSYV